MWRSWWPSSRRTPRGAGSNRIRHKRGQRLDCRQGLSLARAESSPSQGRAFWKAVRRKIPAPRRDLEVLEGHEVFQDLQLLEGLTISNHRRIVEVVTRPGIVFVTSPRAGPAKLPMKSIPTRFYELKRSQSRSEKCWTESLAFRSSTITKSFQSRRLRSGAVYVNVPSGILN